METTKEPEMLTETTIMVSWFLSPNRYGGNCAICDADVDEGAGFVQKDRESGRWQALCRDCVHEHGRVTPVVRDGQPVYGQSVVAGSGSKALVRCNRCAHVVAWCKGKRGRWYLANTYQSWNELSTALRVYDFDAHECEEKPTSTPTAGKSTLVKDRHCMNCGHDFDEVWPAEDAVWCDPSMCPRCESDDTLIAA